MNIYSTTKHPSGFYVYAYIRKSNGQPYYIGKGTKARLIAKHKINIPKDHRYIIVLEENLTEIGAVALERRYIKWYGRKDNGTGILRNMTDGGEGVSGIIYSKERNDRIRQKLTNRVVSEKSKTRMSISQTGKHSGEKNRMFGKQHTEKVKKEHSERMKGNDWNVGKIWIHNIELKKTTSIKKEEPIPNGWVLGMLPRKLR